MIETGAQFGYVIAAWSVTTVLTLAAIAWTVIDSRRQKARLAALEAEGIRRRSDGKDA